MFENIQPFHLLESSAACSVRGSEVLKLLPAPRHSALGKASAPGNLYDGLINMHAECHFNLRASATCQHKNPHPATSMAVPRAPHQTTTSTGQSHVANQSKPCCKTGQQLKAMLQN